MERSKVKNSGNFVLTIPRTPKWKHFLKQHGFSNIHGDRDRPTMRSFGSFESLLRMTGTGKLGGLKGILAKQRCCCCCCSLGHDVTARTQDLSTAPKRVLLCISYCPARGFRGGVGWGGDDDILWTCTHGGCYATGCFSRTCTHAGCYATGWCRTARPRARWCIWHHQRPRMAFRVAGAHEKEPWTLLLLVSCTWEPRGYTRYDRCCCRCCCCCCCCPW